MVLKEKELSIELKKIDTSKKKLSIGFKYFNSDLEKFLFVLKNLKIASGNQIIEDLLFLDNNMTFNNAKRIVFDVSLKLLATDKIGLHKIEDQYSYYILFD